MSSSSKTCANTRWQDMDNKEKMFCVSHFVSLAGRATGVRASEFTGPMQKLNAIGGYLEEERIKSRAKRIAVDPNPARASLARTAIKSLDQLQDYRRVYDTTPGRVAVCATELDRLIKGPCKAPSRACYDAYAASQRVMSCYRTLERARSLPPHEVGGGAAAQAKAERTRQSVQAFVRASIGGIRDDTQRRLLAIKAGRQI